MSDSGVVCPGSALVGFPAAGAVRVHPTPDLLPSRRRQGERAAYRYDDPDGPEGPNPFLVRYLATTLRGCLVEVLAQFRPADAETTDLLGQVSNVDDDAEHEDIPRRGLGSYLAKVKVGRAQLLDTRPLVTVHDEYLLAALDRHPRVRAVLDDPTHAPWQGSPHLDESKIR